MKPIDDTERTEARCSLGLSDDQLVPVYIGRLDPEQKGLDLLIEAVRDLARHRPARLLLAGPPAGRSIGELLLAGDPVTVLPPAFGDEKRRLLAAADLFASPSRWEGQPAAVLEALAHGLPVLISAATGLTEYVQKNDAGMVVETTPPAIAAGLEKLAAKQATLEAASLAARTQATFGPKTIAKQFIEAYESIL